MPYPSKSVRSCHYLDTEMDVRSPIQWVFLSCLVTLMVGQGGILHALHLDIPVSKCPDSPMESSIYRHARRAFISDCLVEDPRHIDTVFVRYLPECCDDVLKTSELAGTGEMDSLISELICFVCTGLAGGEITKKWGVVLKPVVTKIPYSQWVVLPVLEKQTASQRLQGIRLSMTCKMEYFVCT
jgi:hypothetical protein